MFHQASGRPLRPISWAMAALGVTATVLAAAPVAVAAPTNDLIVDAVAIGALPFTDTVDVSGATTDYVPDCVVPELTNGVWYTYTPTTDVAVMFDTVGSDFETGLAVYTGTHDALESVGCDDNRLDTASQVVVRLTAGEQYFIGVGRFNPGGGDQLVLSAHEAPDQLAMHSTLRKATLTASGEVELRFGVVCSDYATVQFRGTVSQRRGHRVRETPFWLDDDDEYCGPRPTTWTALAHDAQVPPARPGKATIALVTRAFIAGGPGVDLLEVFETQQFIVRLHRGSCTPTTGGVLASRGARPERPPSSPLL
jgi:hypothetical protein